jgi:predicted metal-dependent peptidase
VKTPWYDILERYMVGMTKNEYSWKRPNRKYAASDIYLPSIDNVPKMGKVVCQVDISGSVSQREIHHYGGHIARIVEMCRPEQVHVIYTDTDVCKHEVFEEGEEVHINYHSGGGTDMCAGYKWLEKEGLEDADVFITLTDGYTGFPAKVDVPSIWVISSDVTARRMRADDPLRDGGAMMKTREQMVDRLVDNDVNSVSLRLEINDEDLPPIRLAMVGCHTTN